MLDCLKIGKNWILCFTQHYKFNPDERGKSIHLMLAYLNGRPRYNIKLGWHTKRLLNIVNNWISEYSPKVFTYLPRLFVTLVRSFLCLRLCTHPKVFEVGSVRVFRPSKVTCGPLLSIQCLQCGEYLENIYFFGYIMQIFGSIELRIWVQRVMHLLRPRWPSKNPMARSTDMHRWHKYKYWFIWAYMWMCIYISIYLYN